MMCTQTIYIYVCKKTNLEVLLCYDDKNLGKQVFEALAYIIDIY